MTTETAAILTVSDRVSQGIAEDKTGPALQSLLIAQGYTVKHTATVPDDISVIQTQLKQWTDGLHPPALVLTTGGTGFGRRDTTPEAVEPLLHRKAMSLVIAMLNQSLQKTPLAALSRPVAGTRHQSLILTLPGSCKGAKENLEAVLPVLRHALHLLQGDKNQQAEQMHQSMNGSYLKPSIKCHCDRQDETVGSSRSTTAEALTDKVTERPRKSQYPLISYDDALNSVLERSLVLDAIRKPVSEDLCGDVAAEDIYCKHPVPAFNASIVDGYAIKSQNKPGIFRVHGAVTAGETLTEISTPSQEPIAIRITTGAPVPNGCDAVVMVEDTDLITKSENEEETIQIHVTTQPGENIRPIGCDIQVNELILSEGAVVDSVGGALGSLISAGISYIPVIRKPIVALMSTGNEVVDAGQKVEGPSIFDTNRPVLKSLLQKHGFPYKDLGIVPDAPETLRSALESALQDKSIEVLVTTGGVSMGEKDYMKPLVSSLGGQIIFGRVMLKPGKPTTFAVIPREDRKPLLWFGLAGNPVSAVVTFHLFVLPSLKKMAGHQQVTLPVVMATLMNDVQLDPRPEFHRGILRIARDAPSTFQVSTTGHQRSSRLMSLNQANCLVKTPSSDSQSTRMLPKGSIVECLLLNGL